MQENIHKVSVTPLQAGESLVAALARNGVLLRRPCGGAGTCRQCRVRVNGDEVLACQTRIDAACEVEVPAASMRSTTMRVVTESTSTLPITTDVIVAALDIGTTTLAMRLLTPSGSSVTVRPNPQSGCGDDLMSRIGYASESATSLRELQEMVIASAREMLLELTRRAGLSLADVRRLGVAGNTAMQQIFLGLDVAPLGRVPFTPAMFAYPTTPAAALGFNLAADATVELLPILGGFVGGDVMGGVLTALERFACTQGGVSHGGTEGTKEFPNFIPLRAFVPLCEKKELQTTPSLLIDIGTNGEIVIADGDGFVTAATAAGPAFEGARLRAGVVATSGAIESVVFDVASQRTITTTIDAAPAIGICGSGVIDVVATLLDCGSLDSTGRMQTSGAIPLVKTADGLLAWELVAADDSGIDDAIVFTQRDVREFQLACGAIRAGIELLLRSRGLRAEDLKRFLIAGGFGQHISLASARRVGLVPRGVAADAVQLCGNTSLAGATYLAAAPTATLTAALEIQSRTEHIDLASLPTFAQTFAESMCWE